MRSHDDENPPAEDLRPSSFIRAWARFPMGELIAWFPQSIVPELITTDAVASGCSRRAVCHERRMSYLRCATVREMKEGPSSSVIRS